MLVLASAEISASGLDRCQRAKSCPIGSLSGGITLRDSSLLLLRRSSRLFRLTMLAHLKKFSSISNLWGMELWMAEADEDLGEALASGCGENNSSQKDFSPTSQQSPKAFSPRAYSPTALSAASGGTRLARLGSLSPRAAAVISGNFFGALASSEFYNNAKVRDVSGSFRWALFLALQKANSMLTVLLLLSKYKMKSVPVVDLGGAKIDIIITQSTVIHMLAECVELRWFKNWGNKMLSELGLPVMNRKQMIEVYQDEPVL